MIKSSQTANDNCESINLKPAVHRRILNFLNEAISAADLEYLKPLFIHDHEGVPIHDHEDQPVNQNRILDHDIAQKILDFRDLEYPLGFRHLKELFSGDLLNSGVLDTLKHHLGEFNFGEWFSLPSESQIPRRGSMHQGDRTYDGVVHAALLHTGSILFITADETTLLWNPEDVTPASFQDPRNQPHTMPEGYSQLCGHHVFLSDGRLLTLGGGGYGPNPIARWGYKFDPIEKTWTRTSTPMSDSRWYPTAVALGDRKVLVACGHGTGEIDIYDEATDRFTRVELNLKPFPSLYPGLHLLPNSLIFYSRTGWGTAGAGGGPFRGDDQSAYFTLTSPSSGIWNSIAPASPSITDRTKGMSVMVYSNTPPNVRILVFGGADPSTNNTYEVIDTSSLSPNSSWSAPIPFPDDEHRSLCSAVLLPDGNVFMSGGIQRTDSPCALFNPQTNTWLRAAELRSIRDYHSVSLLLPSGQVMMAGWQNSGIEIYNPPYLFHGSRPTIASAPDMIRYGQRFNVETPDAESIGRVVLIRPMAVTHQTDTEQRVIELPFQAQREQLFLAAPDGVEPYSMAPRGYYMLFILNREGVPSVAKWIRLYSPSWHAWFRIGRPDQDVPQRSVVWPVSRNPDRIDIFVIGNNGGIYTSGQTNGGAWEGWHPVGNPGAGENVPTNSVVSAVSRAANRLDIFVVGHNGGIYSSGQTNGGAWESWHPIGNPDAGQTVPTRSVVFPVSRSMDRLDIFVVGNNGGIYTSGQTNGGAWEDWLPIGNPDAGENVPINSVVWAVSHIPNRIDIFVVGHNGGIYTSGQTDGGAWEGWHPIGNPDAGENVPPGSVVSAISRKPEQIDIFVVGHNGGIYSNWWG